ncbi:MAG TPA: LysR family transcriptional regulator [Desulfuromonadales bacterium]|nr:LysR family transcriptional regulator [Desulfuromonadales bacterium]
MMDINELRIFRAVAHKGSISRAAEELHYVQSNVTARIRQLEDRLGTALFHRKSKGVALTASGHLLLDYAERILRLVSEAEETLSDRGEPKGRLVIGSMETTAAVRLPSLLSAFQRSCPEVELSLVTGPSQTSLRRLLDFQIDGAFVAGDVEDDAFVAEKAFEEELVLVAPPSVDPFEKAGSLKILVFQTGCSYRAQLERWLAAAGMAHFQAMEFGSIEGILGCVAAGMGVSVLPRSVVERSQYRETCSLRPLPEDFATMTTWLVRRRGEKTGRALQAFRDLAIAR